jgi:hypothetical protein
MAMPKMNDSAKPRPGLLPDWLCVSGWIILAVQSLFVARIVYESTFLTCRNGPQMIGFALIHVGPSIFLLGILFLPFGALFFVVMLVFGLFKKLRFDRNEWLLLGGYLLGFSLLSLPYSTWEWMDMKVCSSGPLGDSFLQEAAIKGDFGQVKKLVEQGHSVNYSLGDGETPLTSAVRGGRVDVVSFLLANGANVNKQTYETPLMLAASSGDTEMIKVLLDQGADPCRTVKYSDNETAQRIAENKHNLAAAQYLASHSDCKLPPRLPTACAEANSATCVEVH